MKQTSKKQVIVIGGGIAGLGVAALLGRKGYHVTLIEKNNQYGGRASVLKAKGFTFDMGPSWYMMPDIFQHFFDHFGVDAKKTLGLTKLTTQYRVFWKKDDYVDIVDDLQKNLATFATMEPGADTQIRKYLKITSQIHKLAVKKFLYTDFSSFFEKVSLGLTPGISKKLFFLSVEQFISQFVQHERLKQLLTYWAVFLGASPYHLPAIYTMMSHVDLIDGIYYPKNGMRTIVEALVTLCEKYQVKLIKNEVVKNILITNGQATGVVTSKKTYPADIVIANADYAFTETHLLAKKYQTYPKTYWKKKTIAPSMFLLYIGIKGKLKNASHHTLILAEAWKEHFEAIYTTPDWPKNPSIYLCVPSKTDTTVAPAGHENIFVLVPIASGLLDTPTLRKQVAKLILARIEEVMGETITERIVYKKIFTINDYKKLYNAYEGTALGLTHIFSQTAFLRPHIQSQKVNNLYYTGQYTLPGTGVPMCLISANIVAERISKQYEK